MPFEQSRILPSSKLLEAFIRTNVSRQNEQIKQFCRQEPVAIALKAAITSVRFNRAAMIAALQANVPADQLEGTLEAINRLEFLCSALIEQINAINGEGSACFEWLTEMIEHQTVLTMTTDEESCEAEVNDGESVYTLIGETAGALLRDLANHVEGETPVELDQLQEAVQEAIKVLRSGETAEQFWQLIESLGLEKEVA